MGKLTEYSDLIRQILTEYVGNRPLSGVVGFAAPAGLGDILHRFWLRLRSASVVPGTLTYVALSNRHPNPDLETFLIVNETKSHYIWMNLGWQNGDRITGVTVYVRIRDGKFWIEEDWTEAGIATDLVRAGVPKEDIVLAFHEPKMRPYAEFAVAS